MELGIKNDFFVNTPRKTISQTVESNRVCVSLYLYNFVNVLQSSLMLYGWSSQEAEANALTPAKCQGTTIFNLEEHYDENSAIRNSCSTRIKK
ncbi:unnamed protein product, partial [Brassica rapa]